MDKLQHKLQECYKEIALDCIKKLLVCSVSFNLVKDIIFVNVNVGKSVYTFPLYNIYGLITILLFLNLLSFLMPHIQRQLL